jgi:ABC-2 type transport system ATP-binding protein
LALTISGLSKTYSNGVKALQNVSLTIGNNMFGLLGPNGAGKSTLMRTVATLQEPDAGSVSLDGLDVLSNKTEVRKILGYLPQEFGVYPKVSATDMLHHLAVMKGITKKTERNEIVDALLNQTNLWDVRKKSLSTYSGGMKQRFGIAQALLGKPKLIIVDEPTAGLDPAERNRFLNLLSSIGRDVIVILQPTSSRMSVNFVRAWPSLRMERFCWKVPRRSRSARCAERSGRRSWPATTN